MQWYVYYHPAPETVFDTFREFCILLHGLRNGEGLPREDYKLIFNFFQDERVVLSELPQSLTEFDTFTTEVLASNASGWQETTVQLSAPWPQHSAPIFRFRGTRQYVEEHLKNRSLADAFVYEAAAKYTYVDGHQVRVYSEPSNGESWVAAQKEVRAKHGPNSFVLGIQVYSDKTNLTNNGTSAYPIKLAIINLRNKQRISSITTVGFVPCLHEDPAVGTEIWRQAKRELLSKCLWTVLGPLRDASHGGMIVLCPDMLYRTAVPRLLSYVADDPEQRAATNLYGSCQCKRQCCRCYTTSDCLDDLDKIFARRSAAKQAQIKAAVVAAQQAGDQTQASSIMQEWSTHIGDVGIAGWAGQDAVTGDPRLDPVNDYMQCMSFEVLHNIDLGLMGLVISTIKAHADRVQLPRSRQGGRGAGNRALKVLDERLMNDVPRCEGFYPPSYNKYFRDQGANMQAKHHRAVFQVIACLARGLVDDKLTAMLCTASSLVNSIYTRNSVEQFTEKSLQTISKTAKQLLREISTLSPETNTKTPKVHKLQHISDDVKKHGHLKHVSSAEFETDHIGIKKAYRGSSKKKLNEQYIREIVQKQHLQEVLQAEQQISEQLGTSSSGSRAVQEKVKIYMLAQETSQHQVSITFDTISLKFVAYPASAASCANAKYAARSQDVASWDPAMPLLGHRLQEYLLDTRLGYDRYEYRRTDLQPLPFDRIRVHKHAVLAADCPWEPEDLLLQTVRANNSFHGKPFFDFVVIRVATTAASSRVQRTAEEYAQLLLLFSIPEGTSSGGKRVWNAYAYVKWLRKDPGRQAGDPLVKAGAVLLSEVREYDPAERQLHRERPQQAAAAAAAEALPAAAVGGSSATAAAAAQEDSSDDELEAAGNNITSSSSRGHLCGVVPLSAIVRREYVMKDFSRPGGWIKNPFKY